jgi:hypothetical protein
MNWSALDDFGSVVVGLVLTILALSYFDILTC